MPFIDIQGVNIYYEEKGSGEPLIFLHGLGMSLPAHRLEIDKLSEKFLVIALDARGHGRSDRPSRFTLQDHVNDVIALMDHLQLRKASLLGGSMGSYIGQGVAIAVPERIEKLVLVSARSSGKTSSTSRLLADHQEEVAGMSSQEAVQYLSKYMFHQTEQAMKWMDEYHKSFHAMTEAQQAAANKALENFDWRDALYQITAKTLVIGGIFDPLNPPGEGEWIASRIPRAVFVGFSQSGHAPSVEEPDLFIDTVTTFLECSDPRDVLELIDTFLSRLKLYTPEQLCRHSGKHPWSLGQLYDHVIVVAQEYIANADECLSASEEQPEGKTEAGNLLFRLQSFPPVRIQLPDLPGNTPGNDHSKQSLAEGLLDMKDKLNALRNRVLETNPKYKVRHNGFGWLNAKEWLDLVEMHTRHHLRQRSELERAAGIVPAHSSLSSLQSSTN
ncbi:alpha/beta fold hydrolase [Paenibacillus sp. SAF-054]|uniref:alpha/beta fold hydrolase n=1 Tax=unclassified Paenibacillus TaxID=185978 RepID=UPI003F8029FB